MSSHEAKELSLKVMRLAQPQRKVTLWPTVENLLCAAESATGADDTLDTNTALQLQATQGQVYCGETFQAYVHLRNTSSPEPVFSVVLQVELLINQERALLHDNSADPSARLDPEQSYECTIRHGLRAPGLYTLSCVAHYYVASPSGTLPANHAHLATAQLGAKNFQRKTLSRFFKFTASAPFKISHRILHTEDSTLLECNVENQTKEAFLLLDAKVNSIENTRSTRLTNGLDTPLFQGITYMRPSDAYNLLFDVRQDPGAKGEIDEHYLKRAPTYGRLALTWRTPAGGLGKLDGYSLMNYLPRSKPTLSLKVIRCPSSVKLEIPFTVQFEITNNTETTLEPEAVFSRDKMAPLYMQGCVTQCIGPIAPSARKTFSLELVTVLPGIHQLQGITLVDVKSRTVLAEPEYLGELFAY